MSNRRFVVQCEFDHEPTYVYDRMKDIDVITFNAYIPWQLRKKMAEEAAKSLNREI